MVGSIGLKPVGRQQRTCMFHLIYSSRETQAFGVSDLKKLLVGARLRNRDVDVTGMLAYHGGVFLQALEGPETATREVFDRIRKDPRHNDMKVLQEQSVMSSGRVFGDWSMAFADTNGAAKILKGFIELNGRQSLSDLDVAQAIDLLKNSRT